MSHGMETDVLVAGAGPVGLFAALSLARQGLSVRIVDTGVWGCSHSYALALHRRSQQFMRGLGLLDRILAPSYAVNAVALYDRDGRRAQASLEDDAGFAVAVLPQSAIENLLEQALGEHGVRIGWRQGVSSLTPGADRVTAVVDEYEQESRGYAVPHTELVVARSSEIHARYVIGADGYNSQVRRALKLDYPEVGPAAYYAVFEFRSDAGLDHEMRLVLGDGTVDVLWPLPGGGCRWGFQLTDYSDALAEQRKDQLLNAGFGYFPTARSKERSPTATFGRLPWLEESYLEKLIAERARWFEGSVRDVSWRTLVRFERRLAGRFGQGRMWLTGDSAHLTGPAGVQSMNAGFAEAHDLAAVIAAGGSAIDLEQFNQRWTETWRRLHGISGAFSPAPGADPWVSAHAGSLLACLPAYGPDLEAIAAQFQLR